MIYKSSLMHEQLLLLKPDHAKVIDWLYEQHVLDQECKDFISLFTARRDTTKSFVPQEQQVQCGNMQCSVCMLCRTLSPRCNNARDWMNEPVQSHCLLCAIDEVNQHGVH